jgi:hypothetical protein
MKAINQRVVAEHHGPFLLGWQSDSGFLSLGDFQLVRAPDGGAADIGSSKLALILAYYFFRTFFFFCASRLLGVKLPKRGTEISNRSTEFYARCHRPNLGPPAWETRLSGVLK